MSWRADELANWRVNEVLLGHFSFFIFHSFPVLPFGIQPD